MYILKRGSLYHFSRKLPDRFRGQDIPLRSGPRKVGSNGYLRFSLGTGNRQEAQRLGRRVAVEIDEFLADRQAAWERIVAPLYAEEDGPVGEVLQDVFDKMSPEEQARILRVARPVPRPIFSREEIRAAAQLFYADILRIDEDEYGKQLASFLDPQKAEAEGDEDPALPLRDNPKFVEDLPPPGPEGDLEILFSIKVYIPHYLRRATGRSVSFWRLGAGYEPFVRAFRAASRDLLRRRAGEDAPTPAMPEEKPHASSAFGWDDLVNYWLRDCERDPRTAREMQSLVRSFREFLGKKTPAEATKADVTAWLRNQRETRGNTGKTLEKKGVLVGAAFSLAVKDELLPKNPFAGFDYKRLFQKIGIESDAAREPFTLSQLQMLFAEDALFAQTEGRGGGGYYARVWLPLLGLFTGARLDELGRLTVNDVLQQPVPHFRIRRGKNSESLRSVPLHPQLLDLGFLDYVEAIRRAGYERLWPELRGRSALHPISEPHGRWFNRFIHGPLGFPKTVVFHSFRHTFKDLCRNAGIPRDVHHQLTGHASESVGDRYGEGYSLEVLRMEIAKIQLPFDFPRPKPYAEHVQATRKGSARNLVASWRGC